MPRFARSEPEIAALALEHETHEAEANRLRDS